MPLVRRLVVALVAGMLLGAAWVSPAAASGMTINFDKDNYSRVVDVTIAGISDPAHDRTLWWSCDLGTTKSERIPFVTSFSMTLDMPGCTGYGVFSVIVQVDEGPSNTPVDSAFFSPAVAARMTIGMPQPAITGHAFTFLPQYPADYQLPAGTVCRYEFRWGDDASLRNDYNETFGALGFDADAVDGNCPRWTFTLPWVPYRQFELYLSVGTMDGDSGSWGDHYHVRFDASVDGTARKIAVSNLPIVQVLPSTYTPLVGQPITYTRYLIGGASAGSSSTWTAWQGADPDIKTWHQGGGSTFTIRPTKPGNISVGWQRGGNRLFYALYDPPVRYPDRTRPTTTAPVTQFNAGSVATRAPVLLTWTGSDKGWGINTYQLERSLDGGGWKRVLSARVRSSAQVVVPGHSYRFRVRAVDKAGNLGDWDYGTTFRPAIAEDSAASITWRGTWATADDATARSGSLHESGAAGAEARYTFTGRDIAWVAERGPGHGRAKVYLDGVLVTTADLLASADAPARVVFRRHWATKGTHTIRIVVLGTAGRPTVDVDGFAVLR